MSFTPVIAIHTAAALGAVIVGPVALWARRRGAARTRLHRAAGYAWVTLMLATAVSALFIRSSNLPNLAGFSPIHLLIPVVLGSLVVAFLALARGEFTTHRYTLVSLYVSACLIAGGFTLMPQRLLGQLVWGQWLGLA